MEIELDRLPGIYVLIFELPVQTEVCVGRLGSINFPNGWYAYVGSAMGGLSARVRRHLRAHNRPQWHLDYLLPRGVPYAVVTSQTRDSLECSLAKSLSQGFETVRRFGSSDCRCPGHLFHSCGFAPVLKASVDGMKGVGCTPIITLDPTHNPIRLGKLR